MTHPLCVMCEERGVTAATCVDHIVPHRGDLTLFWDSGNWQSLCDGCHGITKQREERRGHTIGCDADGLPLGPEHHWKAGPRRRDG